MNKFTLQLVVGLTLALMTVGQLCRAQAVEQHAPPPQQQQQQQDESYQRIYEAFTKLMDNMSNNSLGNARRLVSRLNQLVGGADQVPAGSQQAQKAVQQPALKPVQTVDERTEQILDRLDKVNGQTDQHTLRQLNDDVSRLISTLSDSYLRNIRRVIERVNRVVGQPEQPTASSKQSSDVLHQSGDPQDQGIRQPGFPGWDEFIVAMDRMQKSLANFVRSSTKLITSG